MQGHPTGSTRVLFRAPRARIWCIYAWAKQDQADVGGAIFRWWCNLLVLVKYASALRS
jgi:hypothetical protein